MPKDELIAALEKATGPDRELDNALMLIQHDWKRRKLSAVATHREWVWVNRETNRWRTTARDGFAFTASIDAALTLVPEGWEGVVHIGSDAGAGLYQLNNPRSHKNSRAATPALAICIASLKASSHAG